MELFILVFCTIFVNISLIVILLTKESELRKDYPNVFTISEVIIGFGIVVLLMINLTVAVGAIELGVSI